VFRPSQNERWPILVFNYKQDTVAALKKKIHAAKPKLSPARQRLTLPPPPGAKSGEVLKDASTLAAAGLKDGSVVLFKDLGMQVCVGVLGV
jgi:hypothetical protein